MECILGVLANCNFRCFFRQGERAKVGELTNLKFHYRAAAHGTLPAVLDVR